MKPDLENMSPYDRWQFEKYGNILDVNNMTDEMILENGLDDLNRFAEWMQEMAEQELLKNEIHE